MNVDRGEHRFRHCVFNHAELNGNPVSNGFFGEIA